MKKTKLILLAALLVSTSGFAKSAGIAKNATDTTSYSRSAPHTSSGGSNGFGLGVTTYSALGGTGGVSALIPLGSNVLQTSFYMGTSGGFSFGITGLYKATVVGTSDTGFHIGGGLGLGLSATSTTSILTGLTTTSTAFALSLGGVVGFHHEIVPNKIQIAFDAGPVLTVLPGVAFSIVPYSTLAGFSVHYFL